jgi:hypothetical protein
MWVRDRDPRAAPRAFLARPVGAKYHLQLKNNESMSDAFSISPQPDPSQSAPLRRAELEPMDPRRCVVLVPFPGHITLQCQCGLEKLQRRRHEVWRVGGYAAIDQGRIQMATGALAAGYEETIEDYAFCE